MNNKLNIATITVGLLLALGFSALLGAFNPLYNYIVDSTLKLSDGSSTYSAWVQAPIPVYLKFYIFHVTNPEDVTLYGAKPILEEKGPYVYSENKFKMNISFDDTGDTAQYANWASYDFEAEMSHPLTDQDNITTINLLMVVAAATSHAMPTVNMQWGLLEKYFNLYETHTVADWLFTGVELPHIYYNFSDCGIPAFENQQFNGSFTDLMKSQGQNVDQIKNNRIGYYQMYNGSSDGTYRVDTGNAGMDNYLHIEQFNHASQLSYWNNTYCDMINGTDGTQFPPRFVSKDATVRMFVPQMCRSLYLQYEKTIDGLPFEVLRFAAPAKMLQGGDDNPDNKCYCAKTGCLGDSMLDVTNCMQGMPIIMSTPHFYQGDGKNILNFEGLHPNKEKHQTFLDLQPAVGVPYEAHKRIQLNFPLGPFKEGLLSFQNLRDMVHPIFWADETAKMGDSDVSTLKDMVVLPYTIVYAAGGSLIGVGTLMVIVGLVIRRRSVGQEA